MKKVPVYFILFLFAVACENNGEEATCSDGIQNGDETGIDCGGSCGECFVCLSSSCAFLAGETSEIASSQIEWHVTQLDGSTIECPTWDACTETEVMYKKWALTFYSTGKFIEESVFDAESVYDDTEQFHGEWSFDDAEAPTKLILNYDGVELPLELTLVEMQAGRLRIKRLGHTATMVPAVN